MSSEQYFSAYSLASLVIFFLSFFGSEKNSFRRLSTCSEEIGVFIIAGESCIVNVSGRITGTPQANDSSAVMPMPFPCLCKQKHKSDAL